MLRYPTYMAVETLTIALITEDGQSFEDLGIEERKEGQIIIKCRAAEPMRDGAPCEWNKMGSDGYPFCASSTEVMRLRDQNAKLREFMKKLYGGYMGGHYMISCRGCEHAYEDCGGYVPLDPDYCVFSDSDRYVGCWKQKRLEAEMRELGVEVDE